MSNKLEPKHVHNKCFAFRSLTNKYQPLIISCCKLSVQDKILLTRLLYPVYFYTQETRESLGHNAEPHLGVVSDNVKSLLALVSVALNVHDALSAGLARVLL